MYVTNSLDGKKGVAIGVDGKLVYAKDPFLLEFDIKGTYFGDSQFNFSSYVNFREMLLVDWNDGTPLERLSIKLDTHIHYFQDVTDVTKINTKDYNYPQVRTIKIYIEKPLNIYGFNIAYCNFLTGSLPMNIGNFKLTSSIRVQNASFTESISELRGVVTAYVVLMNSSITDQDSIPEWIYNSKIKDLTLGGEFTFNLPPEQSNLDKLIKNPILETLWITNLNSDTVPSNFKDISTIRTLRIANARPVFHTFPNNIGDMVQITTLDVGSRAYGYSPYLSSWGVGIGKLINLTSLSYANCHTIPLEVPIGLENCVKIKYIDIMSSYYHHWRPGNYQQFMDIVTGNYYDFVNTYANKTNNVDNNFREVLFYLNNAGDLRPSGNYQQPSGYVQGVTNGTPVSPMEKVWVMVNQYKWKIQIKKIESGVEILQ